LNELLHWSFYTGAAKTLYGDFEATFNFADYFVRELAKLYALSIPVPEIKIHDSNDFVACASSAKEIHLSLGAVLHIAKVAKRFSEALQLAHPNSPSVEKRLIRDSILLLVGHEFFHIARNHHAVLGLMRHNHRDANMAIEFDADNMAIAGLYRYTWAENQLQKAGLSKLQVKEDVMRSAFAWLRDWVGKDDARFEINPRIPKYPPWHVRLANVPHKLALLDTGASHKNPTPPEYVEHGDSLFSLLRACTSQYAKIFGLKPQEDSFARCFADKTFFDTFILPVIHEWEKLEPDVLRLQFLDVLKPKEP
jgi:hypothetical protein